MENELRSNSEEERSSTAAAGDNEPTISREQENRS